MFHSPVSLPPPIERQELANQCRRIVALADPPKEGVLPNLKRTPRDE